MICDLYDIQQSLNNNAQVSSWYLFVILWIVAYQVPLSMEFSRQEYWSELLFLSPGDLPDPGI